MKAILYAAKSTTDVRGSLATQLEDGRALAEREGWDVVGEYSDEAASAWSGDRGPNLAAALAHAEQLAPCALCVQHTDRLARGDGLKARHLIELYLWAMKANVTIRSVQDDSTFDNLIMAAVMGERNAEDSRRKSAAVKAGLHRRAQAGGYSGVRPLGYDIKHGELVVSEAEAVTVRRIYDRYLAGESHRTIAAALRAENVPTARGGQWHPPTVRLILRNPLYIGKLNHHGEVLDGEHEPIVDVSTWERAQDLMAAKARTIGPGRPVAGHHLFRKGMLRCGECGEAMVPRTDPNRKGAPSERYFCYGRKLDPSSCSCPPIERADVDTAVLRYFEQVGLDVDATREAIASEHGRKLDEITVLLEQADREVSKAGARLERVRRDYADGKIGADDWHSFRDELGGELAAAEGERERLRASVDEIERDGAQLDAETETLRYLTEIRQAVAGEVQDAKGADAVRAALVRLFDHFVLHRGIPGRVHIELIGEVWIEPVVREQVVEGYSEAGVPVLKRQPLGHAEACDNNVNLTLPSYPLFEAIRVGV